MMPHTLVVASSLAQEPSTSSQGSQDAEAKFLHFCTQAAHHQWWSEDEYGEMTPSSLSSLVKKRQLDIHTCERLANHSVVFQEWIPASRWREKESLSPHGDIDMI